MSYDLDARIGISGYATKSCGLGGVLRRRPSDFVVEEVVDPTVLAEISSHSSSTRKYAVLLLRKTGLDTLHAVRQVEQATRSKLSYLGLKDARAVTSQYVCLRHKPALLNECRPSPRNVDVERLGYLPRPLTQRDMVGNRFLIVIREINLPEGAALQALAEACEAAEARRIPSFYGYQRFGGGRAITHLVGKEIVAGRLKEALRTLLCYESPRDKATTGELGGLLEDPTQYRAALAEMPPSMDVERLVVAHLAKRPDDYQGAIRAIPLRLRRLFVHAYQAFIYNRTVSRALSCGLDIPAVRRGDVYCTLDPATGRVLTLERATTNQSPDPSLVPQVPLAGYAYRSRGSRFDELLDSVLRGEGVSARQFFLRELGELSAPGGFRHAPLLARDLTWKLLTEEAEPSASVSTLLLRGCYATTLMREIMKPKDPVSAGFC